MTNHRAAFTVPGFASKRQGGRGAGAERRGKTPGSYCTGNGGKTGAGGMAGVAS